MIRWINNRHVIFSLAVLLGLCCPRAAAWTKVLMIPALAMVMTLATISVPNHYFRNVRDILGPSLAGIGMTYGVLSSVILMLSAWLIADEKVWMGFVLVAAVPPAVAVIPFTALLKGDVSYTLSGTVASYVAALLLLPLIIGLFLQTGFQDPSRLMRIMVELIFLPLMLSRVILYFRWQEKIIPVRGVLTDWGFFVVLYSMIGVNRDLIFSQPQMLLPIGTVVFVSTFVVGWLIQKSARYLQVNPSRIISLILLGTLKNQGLAGGLAIALFEKEAALPATLYSLFMILYIIWLGWRKKQEEG